MKEIIVIGAGISGLTCSLRASQKGIKVKLFSPSPSERSQSVMAMGGINAALNNKQQNDSITQHYNDTMNGGQNINNPEAVKKLTTDAPEIVEWLSDIGTSFTRDENNNIDQRYFGGQKKKRTAYAGAKTGKQIVTALITQCRKYESEEKIIRYVGWRLLSLITSKDNKECFGVIMINELSDEIKEFYADSIIIASGGMNNIFGKISGSTQNDGCATGILLQQYVQLANLEMIQYHPTTIKTPVKRMLITEAARGDGGRLYTLRDGKKWYFMEEWYPEFGALMPRDIVSRSIYKVCNILHCGINDKNMVYLDISHLPEKTVKTKLDEVYDVCTQYLKLDPTKEPIPVYPGIHYFMGGIRTDEFHKTNIKRLYAIGECSSQYHGANRLGGNSLLGAVHGGWIVAEEIEKINKQSRKEIGNYCQKILKKELNKYEQWKNNQKDNNNLISAYTIEKEISDIMNRTMSIYREEKQLIKGIKEINMLIEKIDKINTFDSYYEYIKINSLLHISKAMILSALNRKESRGSHQRIDYPEKNDAEYKKTTVIVLSNNGYNITFEDINKQMDW